MERVIADVGVLVVGGAGFLGSHLVEHLIKDRRCAVVVMDNLVVGKRHWVHPEAAFVHHDICGSEEFVKRVIAKYRIEYVFNYAAWPYIPDSFDRPLHVFNTNAMGAIKVINAAHDAGVQGILQISSAELYGEATDGGKINELYPVVPHSTYGAAKAAVDYYCQAAWKERQTPVITLRQFNCVGERESHPYVIPEIVSQLAKHAPSENLRPSISLGNNSTRDFLYAGDAVRAAVELLERGEFGEVYNLGSEEAVRIYDLANVVAHAMGFRGASIDFDVTRTRPWEIWHLKSDNSKIYRAINYRPQVSLREAINRTVEYFHSNGNKWEF